MITIVSSTQLDNRNTQLNSSILAWLAFLSFDSSIFKFSRLVASSCKHVSKWNIAIIKYLLSLSIISNTSIHSTLSVSFRKHVAICNILHFCQYYFVSLQHNLIIKSKFLDTSESSTVLSCPLASCPSSNSLKQLWELIMHCLHHTNYTFTTLFVETEQFCHIKFFECLLNSLKQG